MFNLESMRITIVSDNFPGNVVSLIKMFCLKFHKTYLNRVLETPVLEVPCYVLIELMYNVIFDEVMICCLKIQAISKESFEIISF